MNFLDMAGFMRQNVVVRHGLGAATLDVVKRQLLPPPPLSPPLPTIRGVMKGS